MDAGEPTLPFAASCTHAVRAGAIELRRAGGRRALTLERVLGRGAYGEVLLATTVEGEEVVRQAGKRRGQPQLPRGWRP
jgi:hypothetical protein